MRSINILFAILLICLVAGPALAQDSGSSESGPTVGATATGSAVITEVDNSSYKSYSGGLRDHDVSHGHGPGYWGSQSVPFESEKEGDWELGGLHQLIGYNIYKD